MHPSFGYRISILRPGFNFISTQSQTRQQKSNNALPVAKSFRRNMPNPADRNKTQPFRISSQTLATIRELTHHRSQWSAASRRDTGQIDTWTRGLESDRQDSALGLRARKNAETTRPIKYRSPLGIPAQGHHDLHDAQGD
ncbi:hypothetical protein [Chromobacterium violaceum]|uniref:hypothetical protein n=1 Tax=Chromobacterium violaceum TaxID=536 RepID=UPI0012D49846|nr:hypothetical protein [Chromobacterium violaceum]